MDFNPLWIIVIVAVSGALIKGLFWLRDVHTAKDRWTRFTIEQFPHLRRKSAVESTRFSSTSLQRQPAWRQEARFG